MNDANFLIDAQGGTSEVAKLCNLTTGAISQWRHNGIPKPWLMFFMQRRPDLFTGQRDANHLPDAGKMVEGA